MTRPITTKVKSILLLLFVLTFFSSACATIGIGLKWSTESEIAQAGENACITYGIYNPFDRDVNGYLEATGDLKEIYTAEEPKLIPASTSSQNAVQTEICFKIPKKPGTILHGEVVAAFKPADVSGTGSAVGTSFAAPLTIAIAKNPNIYLPWIMLVIGIIAVLAAAIWVIKKKKIRLKIETG
jgi:hypothetical protein